MDLPYLAGGDEGIYRACVAHMTGDITWLKPEAAPEDVEATLRTLLAAGNTGKFPPPHDVASAILFYIISAQAPGLPPPPLSKT
jgi:hypothetical protein